MTEDMERVDKYPKSSTDGRTGFFYGTLMAPAVLHRVCHGNSRPENPLFATHQLVTKPAILHGFRRQRVQGADYPAIVPRGGASVRGTVVTGLTDADIWRMDIFEGDEYHRQKVGVRVLTTAGASDGSGNVEGDEIEAEAYVWNDSDGLNLEAREWDFAEFEREKLRFWTGDAGEQEYQGMCSTLNPRVIIFVLTKHTEVDEAVADAQRQDGTGGRGLNGHISNALQVEHERDEPLKSAV